MSEINNDQDEIVIDDVPKEGDEGYDKFDWKAHSTKQQGIIQRQKTKLEKLKGDQKPVDQKPADKKDGDEPKELDRMDKIALKTAGITDEKEIELVQKLMKETNKDVDSLIETNYFKTELKAHREAAASDTAIPKNGDRSGTPTRDTVEYWIAKGELPPADQRELRQKVVNAKIKAKQSGNQFSDNPIT